jgi:uncharacterized DUF497 family protein
MVSRAGEWYGGGGRRLRIRPGEERGDLAKHGIDFETAQALWLDVHGFEIDARSETEPRSAVIGTIEGRHWTAFFTLRGEVVRIISVRRARDDEVEAYERQENR